MITIVIAKDEKKIKEVLAGLLKQEGYTVTDSVDGSDNIIRIASKYPVSGSVSLKDKVIELQNSLFNEKKGVLYKTILDEIEKPIIENALERTEGNQLKAARILGINRNTMRSKIKRLAIDVSKWKV